jgi:uncharacterized RmlC-like cupin family protein
VSLQDLDGRAETFGDDLWHRPITRIRGCDVSGDTTQTSGMSRFEAVSGKTVGSQHLWVGRTHVSAGASSGNHHHGEAETVIYVVSGTPRFVFAEGTPDGWAEVAVDTEPGDFVFVPPWVPHREENPGDTEAVVVISRSTQEGIVVNLPQLWTPRPGTDPAP